MNTDTKQLTAMQQYLKEAITQAQTEIKENIRQTDAHNSPIAAHKRRRMPGGALADIFTRVILFPFLLAFFIASGVFLAYLLWL